MNVRSLLLSAALVAIATPAAAQGLYEQTDLQRQQDSIGRILRKDFQKEMAQLAARFWEPRLNSYRVRIDEAFSSSSLQELNQLRVRFTLFCEKMQEQMEAEERRAAEYEAKYRSGEYMYDTTVAAYSGDNGEISVATPEGYEYDDEMTMDTATIAVATPGEYDETYAYDEYGIDSVSTQPTLHGEFGYNAEEARARREQIRLEREAEQDARYAELEQRLASEGTLGDEDALLGMGYYAEMIELPAISKWLARRHRAGLDIVGETVFADLRDFVDTVNAFKAKFIADRARQIALAPESADDFEDYSDMDELTRLLRHPLYLKHMYVTRIEPYVLLFNGDGLRRVMAMVGQGSRDLNGNIPETSLLAQATPNPASTTTSITFTIPEASSATMLRLYNAQGDLAIELPQGALAAGTHTVSVDVSDLPSGSYVYQLSTQVGGGEKLSSKVMQVVN